MALGWKHATPFVRFSARLCEYPESRFSLPGKLLIFFIRLFEKSTFHTVWRLFRTSLALPDFLLPTLTRAVGERLTSTCRLL
jgi:hypothetical protein